MASELIDKVRAIRGTSFTLTDGSEHVLLTSEESQKIIEALQAMADLETLVQIKDTVLVLKKSCDLVDVRFASNHKAGVSFQGCLGTIPAALRAAAAAIQKGGTE